MASSQWEVEGLGHVMETNRWTSLKLMYLYLYLYMYMCIYIYILSYMYLCLPLYFGVFVGGMRRVFVRRMVFEPLRSEHAP